MDSLEHGLEGSNVSMNVLMIKRTVYSSVKYIQILEFFLFFIKQQMPEQTWRMTLAKYTRTDELGVNFTLFVPRKRFGDNEIRPTTTQNTQAGDTGG